MRRVTIAVVSTALFSASPLFAQLPSEAAEPFKLGTFQIDAGPTVGIVSTPVTF